MYSLMMHCLSSLIFRRELALLYVSSSWSCYVLVCLCYSLDTWNEKMLFKPGSKLSVPVSLLRARPRGEGMGTGCFDSCSERGA